MSRNTVLKLKEESTTSNLKVGTSIIETVSELSLLLFYLYNKNLIQKVI